MNLKDSKEEGQWDGLDGRRKQRNDVIIVSKVTEKYHFFKNELNFTNIT